ncbi:MAG: endonuclease/exonuclease/phosphatase family protein [Alkalibacterium sp.]|uniref:endonuclease/exonuclease/phosphatase family protein n=1 Tax=Alkalibacterium sp. TaxID=1872447 RepID=UPI00397054D1
MKVLTLNTHAWMEEKPLEKIDQLIDWLAANEYSFIALQEVNQSMDAETVSDSTFVRPTGDHPDVEIKADNFALLIVEGLRARGLSYFWSWTANHIGYDTYDEGVAILSRYPIEAQSLRVSKSKDYAHHYTRRLLRAATWGEQENWTVVSCHYSWWQDASGEELFKHEWNQTLKSVEDAESSPLLVMGDFNNEASVSQEGYDYIKETAPYLTDAFIEAKEKIGDATVSSAIDGWDDHTDEKRIDYIFTNSEKGIASYRVVFDGQNGPVVSDHFGVEVTLTEA